MSSDDSVPRNFADVFHDIVQLGNKVNTKEFLNSLEEKC